MIINLTLSDLSHPVHTRVSEIGVILNALLTTFGEYEGKIAETSDANRIEYLKLEQAKTGEVFQRLMDTIDAAKEGRGV